MFRILIVEDEPEAYEVLCRHLRRYGAEHEAEFRVGWLKTAVDFISTGGQYDLIFMDIELPGINGMEATELLRTFDTTTPVVFVTNLAQYAMCGYAVRALDFIVKPVGYSAFVSHMNRVMETLRRNVGKSMVFPTKDGVRVIKLSEAIFVEVRGHVLTFVMDSGEKVEVRGSLAEVEEASAEGPLVRISKSCLANMEQICSVRGSELVMAGGVRLSVSRSMKQEAIAKITEYLGGLM